MSPLETFHQVVKKLTGSPSEFWNDMDRTQVCLELREAIATLIQTLEEQELTNTLAYNQVKALEQTIENNTLHEVDFLKQLQHLLDLYRQSPDATSVQETLDPLIKETVLAKEKILEHHLLLERLGNEGRALNQTQKDEHDLKMIQKIGVFYVLEYTIQVQYELSQLSDVDGWRLLKEGLITKTGNMPAYLPLESSFRRELSYAFFDPALRQTIRQLFDTFDPILFGDDLNEIKKALKQFNIELLSAFEQKGLVQFKAMTYGPFGMDIPVLNLLRLL